MKKFKKGLTAIFYVVFVTFTMLFIWHPHLMQVLHYRTPDAETYKAFPQEVVHKSDSAFHFYRAKIMRTDLDTLLVEDNQHQNMAFKDYFNKGELRAFLVIRNDTLIYEKYSKGYSDSTLHSVFSGAKSMVSILLGIALADKRINSLNDRVTNYIPELKENPAFAKITVKQLLDMKSGLAFQDAFGGLIQAFFSDEAKYYYTSHVANELKKQKLAHQPGTFWQYKSIDPILLGWVIKNATGQSVAQYFENKLWKRIGAEHDATWGLDQVGGITNTASRFQVTAIDWAKIGRLYLKNGFFNSQQIVPANWVYTSTHLGGDKPVVAKGWQKATQHYLWWLPQEGLNGDFSAEGMLGQYLYVDRKTNTIIVQFASKGAGNYPYRKISRFLAGLK